MTETLKGCPFCRSIAAVDIIEIENSFGLTCEAYAECGACGAKGPEGDDVDEARRLWNKAARVLPSKKRPSQPIEETAAAPPPVNTCAGGIDPGWDKCPKCGASSDDACGGTPRVSSDHQGGQG